MQPRLRGLQQHVRPCKPGSFNPEAGEPCRACNVGFTSTDDAALVCEPCPFSYTTTREGSTECDGFIEGYYRDPTAPTTSCRLCPENAYCAGDSVPGTTLLPVPLAGFWSNRSDIELVHLIHECPRGEEVCKGGLTNMSFGAEGELLDQAVARAECWLPDTLTSDAHG